VFVTIKIVLEIKLATQKHLASHPSTYVPCNIRQIVASLKSVVGKWIVVLIAQAVAAYVAITSFPPSSLKLSELGRS